MSFHRIIIRGIVVSLVAVVLFGATAPVRAAVWQYSYPCALDRRGDDGKPVMGRALLWLPPASKQIRGVLVSGQIFIEMEVSLDPAVRKACAENDIAILYFQPHIAAVFHFWEPGNTDAARFLAAIADAAKVSGHPEINRVPWITMGHSTAGIYCRNVAYWRPERVAGILHIKSGNFFQKDHLPPTGSLAGVPLASINGQFEIFGPAEGIQPELGRQTQWIYVRKSIEQFRQKDQNYLMSEWIDLGNDHLIGSTELDEWAAMFIAKTAKYRLQATIPEGDGPIACNALKPESGWLVDDDIYHPAHKSAAFADYDGDKSRAYWLYDQEMAEAWEHHHRIADHHQCLMEPTISWLNDDNGYTFKVHSDFAEKMPTEYGGADADKPVGHATTPIVYRCKDDEPVEQIGPDTFRLLRVPTNRKTTFSVAAFNSGDENFRPTIRWKTSSVPPLPVAATRPSGSDTRSAIDAGMQVIGFANIADVQIGALPLKLAATASSYLPIRFEVDYGPLAVKGGQLVVDDLPQGSAFPIECKVTAYQIGSRVGDVISPAKPVSRTFKLLQ